jgi:hypothetical protein
MKTIEEVKAYIDSIWHLSYNRGSDNYEDGFNFACEEILNFINGESNA